MCTRFRKSCDVRGKFIAAAAFFYSNTLIILVCIRSTGAYLWTIPVEWPRSLYRQSATRPTCFRAMSSAPSRGGKREQTRPNASGAPALRTSGRQHATRVPSRQSARPPSAGGSGRAASPRGAPGQQLASRPLESLAPESINADGAGKHTGTGRAHRGGSPPCGMPHTSQTPVPCLSQGDGLYKRYR